MNKKGFAEAASNMFGYLFLFFLTLIFWIIAAYIQGEMNENLNKQTSIDDSKTNLLLFLREPVPGKDYAVAELLIESEFDFNKRKELRELTEKRFDEKYGENWKLKIKYPNKSGYGTQKVEYGHGYVGQKIKTWAKWFARLFLPDNLPIYVRMLPYDERIIVSTTLPSYETGEIELSFENWILFVI